MGRNIPNPIRYKQPKSTPKLDSKGADDGNLTSSSKDEDVKDEDLEIPADQKLSMSREISQNAS